jgi:lipoprotein NlpI
LGEEKPLPSGVSRRGVIVSAARLGLAVLLASPAPLQAEEPPSLASEALAALERGELAQATTLAARAIEADPKQPQAWALRAHIYGLRRDYARSIADWTRVLELDPKRPEAWQRRGEERFRAGQITECLADFDRYLELQPSQKPHHWQRGIALYYAGRFADGQRQFALHQTVNTQDVENAVWHFLCTARAESLAAAKAKLIPITGDARIPMAQVHRMFAGKAEPGEVLAAAEAAPMKTRAGEPRFYAHLYLGIYFEAAGEMTRAREHILKAADRADANGYMGDVARVHAAILAKRKP